MEPPHRRVSTTRSIVIGTPWSAKKPKRSDTSIPSNRSKRSATAIRIFRVDCRIADRRCAREIDDTNPVLEGYLYYDPRAYISRFRWSYKLKIFAALILAGVVAGLFPDSVAVCNCAANECCNLYGYCGIGPQYCGDSCRGGPCCSKSPDGDPCIGNGSRVSAADVITEDFFNLLSPNFCNGGYGREFYTRTAFLKALNSYTKFGTEGSPIDSKREIAAFFAHIVWETKNLCLTAEPSIVGMNKYCNKSNEENPCTPGRNYRGRGPLMLKWNYNYGPAGRSIGFDGLGSPEMVAIDPVVSFKTALWLWMNKVHSNTTFAFGATMKAIYGLNCGNIDAENGPLPLYEEYCYAFSVNPGLNLTC